MFTFQLASCVSFPSLAVQEVHVQTVRMIELATCHSIRTLQARARQNTDALHGDASHVDTIKAHDFQLVQQSMPVLLQ